MSSHLASANTESSILARLIQAEREELSRDAAEYLLSIRFDDYDTAGMNHLSELAHQGKLTDGEQMEARQLYTSLQSGERLAVQSSPCSGARG